MHICIAQPYKRQQCGCSSVEPQFAKGENAPNVSFTPKAVSKPARVTAWRTQEHTRLRSNARTAPKHDRNVECRTLTREQAMVDPRARPWLNFAISFLRSSPDRENTRCCGGARPDSTTHGFHPARSGTHPLLLHPLREGLRKQHGVPHGGQGHLHGGRQDCAHTRGKQLGSSALVSRTESGFPAPRRSNTKVNSINGTKPRPVPYRWRRGRRKTGREAWVTGDCGFNLCGTSPARISVPSTLHLGPARPRTVKQSPKKRHALASARPHSHTGPHTTATWR